MKKQTLGGVHGLVYVHYAGFVLGRVCFGKALSGGKLWRTIGEGVIPLTTVAIYRNK